MMRQRVVPVVLAAAALIGAGCSADGPDATGPTDIDGATESDDGPAASTTDPAPTTDAGGPSSTDASTRPQGFGPANLEFFGDCDALLTYMQTEAAERVTPWGLGEFFYATDGGGRDDSAESSGDVAAPDAAIPSTGGIEGEDFSGTNVQELGVDEGDIVETDGEFVYVAGVDGVRIVSVESAEVVAEPDLPDGSHQLLLDGERLGVVTASWSGSPDTVVSLYDVADPADPALLRRTHLEGSIAATRAIDGVARLVITTSFDQRLPFVQPDQFGLDEETALERNKEIIAESTVDDWLPRSFEEDGDGAFGPMTNILPCDAVAAPPTFSGLGISWVGSLDLFSSDAPVGSAGIVSTGDIVYASADNLYVTTRDWSWQWGRPIPFDESASSSSSPSDDPEEDTSPPPTLIHQFSLDEGTGATYVASGQVEGRLLNQFAMSEYEGDLRVATTNDDMGGFGEQSNSTVFVLRPNGETLEEIGSVGDLGIDEQIYAVRFIGELGYVVTFRQIDPLYVIDLSEPTDPVMAGELKIPGYSSYLHPVGEGLLLGVGQDADDEGRTTGTQLSLFDVSDPAAPQRISTLPIGGFSEVEWDHKAFLYWEPDGTIVLPVSPGWDDCGDDVDCLAKEIVGAGGAVVAELDGRELAARGVINHASRGSGCWNPLQRSIVIGDEVVTIGLDQLTFSDRQSLEPRDSVRWGSPDEYGCYWYGEG
jgi:hypothetical protein